MAICACKQKKDFLIKLKDSISQLLQFSFKKNILYVWITINVICKEEKMTKKSRKKWPRFATQNCQQSESTHQVIRLSKLRLYLL